MKRSHILACLIAGVLMGCHKQETATQTPSPGPDKPLPPPPRYVSANADNNLRQNAAGLVDPFLTTQLRAFVSKNGRLPQSFAEFASKALDSVPRPPEGKKWVIDSASQEVKAVDK